MVLCACDETPVLPPGPVEPPTAPPVGLSEVEWGELLFVNHCVACHQVNGSTLVGPPLNGLGGQPRILADGRQGVVDEAYLLQAVFEPDTLPSTAYGAAMPSFDGTLTEVEGDALVAYMMTLR